MGVDSRSAWTVRLRGQGACCGGNRAADSRHADGGLANRDRDHFHLDAGAHLGAADTHAVTLFYSD